MNKGMTRSMTRREMIRNTGLAVAASGAFVGQIHAQSGKLGTAGQLQKSAKKQALVPSVFLSCQPPGNDEDGPAKYKNGDTQAVLPLVAFWLLATTEDWDNCFNKSGWIDQLVAEFGRENTKLADANLQKALAKTMGEIWSDLKTGPTHDALVTVRTVFRNHSNVSALYGGRPCPGGGTILDVVGLVPRPRP